MTRAKGRRVMTENNEDRGFYNIHSGLKGRDGGPYLDQIERQVAEQRRAVAENREPDFDNPLPATAGVPLVTAANVVDNSLTSNPSMAGRPGFEIVLTDDVLGESSDVETPSLVKPVSVLPVDTGDEPYDPEAQDISPEDVNLIQTGRGDQVSGESYEPTSGEEVTEVDSENTENNPAY